MAGCASSPRATSGAGVAAAPTRTAQAGAMEGAPQASAEGTFIVRLGADTIAVEHYRRSAQLLEGELVLRSPRTRVLRYRAALGPDGRITRIESSVQEPGGQAGPVTRVELGADSVITRIPRGDSVRVVARAANGIVIPWVGNSWALAEHGIARALATGRDTVNILFVGFGGGEATTTFVRRSGPRTVEFGYFGDPVVIRTDDAGRIQSVDGSRTTNKTTAERVASLDIDALAREFAARDAAGRGLGALSTRDTVRSTVGGAELMVDYGRPSKRGRTIWGGVVPWGQVWRTGANEATHFSTSRDLVIGGVTVPAGRYTLWTIPSPSGATLIINRRVGEWGTEYDAAYDVARIDVRLEPSAPALERFTIAIEPTSDGGVMRLMWDERAIVVPFTLVRATGGSNSSTAEPSG